MAKKKSTSEEIIHRLREADVLLGQGHSIAQACKQLEAENARLKKAVAELPIDKIILKEVAEGKF